MSGRRCGATTADAGVNKLRSRWGIYRRENLTRNEVGLRFSPLLQGNTDTYGVTVSRLPMCLAIQSKSKSKSIHLFTPVRARTRVGSPPGTTTRNPHSRMLEPRTAGTSTLTRLYRRFGGKQVDPELRTGCVAMRLNYDVARSLETFKIVDFAWWPHWICIRAATPLKVAPARFEAGRTPCLHNGRIHTHGDRSDTSANEWIRPQRRC